MLTKEMVIETIRNMPEEKFDDIDVLLERLVILDKIQNGIEQADNGKTTPLDQVLQEMKTW